MAAIVPGLAGQDGFAGCYADEGRGLDVTFDVHLAVRAHDCQAETGSPDAMVGQCASTRVVTGSATVANRSDVTTPN